MMTDGDTHGQQLLHVAGVLTEFMSMLRAMAATCSTVACAVVSLYTTQRICYDVLRPVTCQRA
jgi:hypothetical protein